MKAYWDDCGRGVGGDAAVDVDLDEALRIWSDEVRGVRGNFLGLIDRQDRTIQFYFDQDIPDDVDDARQLRIVLLDFPVPAQKGSFSRTVSVGEVADLIHAAFKGDADFQHFGPLKFATW